MCRFVQGEEYNFVGRVYCTQCRILAFQGAEALPGQPFPYPIRFVGHNTDEAVQLDVFDLQFEMSCPWCGISFKQLVQPCSNEMLDGSMSMSRVKRFFSAM